MKRGFTLVELLAVIIIIAVLSIIVVPIITGIINDSKRQAFEVTARYLLDGAKKYLMMHEIEIQETGKKNFIIENKGFVGDEIPMNGELPNAGELEISSLGTIQMAVNNGSLCALKGPYNQDLLVTSNISDCSIIEVTPEACFVFNSTTNTITDYLYTNAGCLSDVVIPNTIGGKNVINIGYRAFYNNNLTSVIIPDTVTSIGEDAFYINHMTTAIIPNSVTRIDAWAFQNNLLTTISIPNQLTTLSEGVFYENQLTSVVIPKSVTTIGHRVFYENQITNLTIPSTVKTIGNMAFWGNNLTTIVIPNGVTTIGGTAFYDNQLTNVYIPSSVTSIGGEAFCGNRLTNIYIPTSVTSIGSAAFNDNLLPDNQAIVYARNSDGSDNTSTIVSYGGTKKDNITVPTGVVTIGPGAFYGNDITSVTFPNTLTTIGSGAFQINKLTNIAIPSSVTSMGGGAFNDNQLPDNQAFIYARNPDGSNNTNILVSYGGANKNNIVIPTGVIALEDGVFYNGSITGTVTIPNTVTTIDSWTFGQNHLTSILIPNSVTSIGGSAFRYNNITQGNAKIDNTACTVTIGSYAFYNNGASQTTTITPTYLR